jgi:2-polyprenyl-3-methyl-5-hydroxy-6-metoxy-1,4-benzoquinol methylase
METHLNEIRVFHATHCYLCGDEGRILYHDLSDRLFGVSGKWGYNKCTNPQCGLIWLNPMPTKEDLGKAYTRYYTHRTITEPDTFVRRLRHEIRKGYIASKFGYTEGVSWWHRLCGWLAYLHPGQREEMDSSVMYLPSSKGKMLLEIGFGSGKVLNEMSKLGWDVQGVDFDDENVRQVRTQYGLAVHSGLLEEIKYPDDYFDAIFLSHVIEHVHDPISLIKECERILKEQGMIVLLTPNAESLSHIYFKSHYLGNDVPRHLSLFSKKTINELARRSDVHVVRCCSTIRGAAGMFVASWNIKKTGKHSCEERPSIWHRMSGHSYQYLQWLCLKFNKNLGEELLVILSKCKLS